MNDNFNNIDERIEIYGARENNLKNIDLFIPRNQFTVITGLSGSGKSSLAFDTIYAEGQRRYIETFSAYARQFMGELKKPDVDNIVGLSPVISIEQKTINKNPRSTVGTITEIYDFLRLLFARISDAYSIYTGEKMVKYSEEKIIEMIIEKYSGKKISIFSPLVRGRKGHYKELFEHYFNLGFSKVRIDGKVTELKPGLKTERYKIHNIELLIDRIEINQNSRNRVSSSIKQALQKGNGIIMIIDNSNEEIKYYSKHLMCPTTGISYPDPEPNTFSFNSPYGACQNCNGLGSVVQIDKDKLVPNPNLSIREGAILPLGKYKQTWIFKIIEAIGNKYNFTLDTPFKEIPEEAIKVIFYGTNEILTLKHDNIGVNISYNYNYEGILNFFSELIDNNEQTNTSLKKWLENFTTKTICPECNGSRLKKESLHFKILDKSIADLATMDILTLNNWINSLEDKLENKKKIIAKEILKEIKTRLQFLIDVGLDYLSLNRSSDSLSGGESQRIRLATQIGTQLTGVTYILDEPSIGLHIRDNKKLIESLHKLKDLGNTIIVVEHDKEIMLNSEYIIDLGPGAGTKGGYITSHGTLQEFLKSNCETALYLKGNKKIDTPQFRRKGNGKFIIIKEARGNNLKNITVKIPLGMMVAITGVSGSGKSSLIHETLYYELSNRFYNSKYNPLPFGSIEGVEHINKVIEIDQAPIGRSPRSNPATYTKVFDEIRKLFASLPESQVRGYNQSRFSFNVKGGRCETCQGVGVKIISMNFLPDVSVPCETCKGQRYNRETLEIRFKGKNINDILNMTINQALDFFSSIPSITQKLTTLNEVGLGYLTLGQPSTTLSGGEAQRIKIAAELSKKDTGKTLYILDEPTTGLHFEDIRILLKVLNQLVDKGNTVIIIEHNLDIIKTCDYIIDLGPEGGKDGGYIVAEGTPEDIIKSNKSYTAKFLAKELNLLCENLSTYC